jgi:glycosidase
MAEGPFGKSCADGKPFAVLHRRRGSGEVHRKPGSESAAGQTPGSPESPHPIKRERGLRFVLLLGLCALFGTAAALAVADNLSSFVSTDQIRTISFSDSCTSKVWSQTPENTLTLSMGATPAEPCRTEIFFKDPLPLKTATAIDFEAHGTRPHQQLSLEARQRTEDSILTASSDDYAIGDEWERFRWNVSRPTEGRALEALTSLVLLTQTPGATLSIRGLQLYRPVSAVNHSAIVAEASPERSVTAAKKAVIVDAPRMENRWADLQGLAAGLVIPVVLLAFVGAFFRRLHVRQEASLFSPLYEINMRTWKSAHDKEGSPHMGGLRSLSVEDLRDIKASGFQSIWLMGVWEVGSRVRAMSKQYGEDFQGSPYAIYDYKVSQDLGTEQDLDAIVREAHRMGLKVIVDFVPNHMGIDSAWLNTHPEYFLHKLPDEADKNISDTDLLQRYPSYFPYRTPAYPENDRRVPKTILVAYGRDPFFYPWIDTAQLDYARPELREYLKQMLSGLARRVDGVRCDMAMLVLREQIKIHRHSAMPREEFDRLMPNEFWSEAIEEVKKTNPHFLFVAETYWSMESQLQQLGFDYTYNKPLYEAICSAMHDGHAEGLMNFLRVLGTEYLSRSLHFLENHDEERAMNALGEQRQRPAAVLLTTLPGLALIHQGQMEGRRERLPVQRVVPLQKEAANESLTMYYKHLLQTTSLPVFRKGRLHVLYSNNPAFISYARGGSDQQALIIINTSAHVQKGMVYVTPGLRLASGISYWLHDLYYDLKSSAIRELSGVQPAYQAQGAQLLKQGLYVELQPFDAHIFLVAPDRSRAHKKRFQSWIRTLNRAWDFPLPARRLFGNALIRSSDQTFAADSLAETREVH